MKALHNRLSVLDDEGATYMVKIVPVTGLTTDALAVWDHSESELVTEDGVTGALIYWRAEGIVNVTVLTEGDF